MKRAGKDIVFSHRIEDQLTLLGANIKRARIRRRMSQQQLADRTFVSRQLIARVEQGNPSVSLGVVAQVLWCVGLLDDLGMVADPDRDEHGKVLEQASLPKRVGQRPASDPLLQFLAEES